MSAPSRHSDPWPAPEQSLQIHTTDSDGPQPHGSQGPPGSPHGKANAAPQSGLQIRLLGSFEVRVDQTLLTQWPRKDALQLLKLLVVQVNHRIHRAQAVRLLWPDDDLRPEQRLNNAVYMLRKTLERERTGRGESRFITTANDTIAFAPSAQLWTDIEAFERFLDLGMPEPHNIQDLVRAVDLYKGDLLPDDGHATWCLYAREQLKQRCQVALRTLSERACAQGESDLAVHSLRRLLAVQPGDEASHRALISILVQRGKFQEARSQYEACRAALAVELGTPPSAETRAALSNLTSLPGGDAAHEAGTLPTLDTAEKVAEADTALDVPLAKQTRRLRPPSAVQALIGRASLLQHLAALIRAGHRAVTLGGPGGVGKTLFSLHLAQMLEADFTDGACFVQLSDVLEPQAVPGILARAFHVAMDSNKNWEQALEDFLQDRHMLVVLDNFEHLLEAAPMVSWMLSIAPRLHVVCTSRSVLKFGGERLFPIPPLELPDPQCIAFSALTDSPAVQLFVERAQAWDPTFALTEVNAVDVCAICHRLDGLPLAMELAAARLKLLGLKALRERLESSFDLLHRGRRDSPDRHRSLDAVLQWSYELLPAEAQAVFRALGMFAGGTTFADAQAVIDMPSMALTDAMDQLLEQNLLLVDRDRPDDPGAAKRLRMLQTVRDYALHQLERMDSQAIQQRRFVQHWAQVAERIYKQRTSGEYRQAIAVFDREFVNFETAVHWAALNDRAISHQFVATLAAFWGRRGFASEFFAWSRSHLDLNEPHQASSWYSTACYATGILSFAVGDYETGRPYIEKALQVSRESAQAAQELLALGHLAVLEYVHGHVEQAMSLNEQAMRLADLSGDQRSASNIVMNLGEMHLTMGNYDQAQQCFNHGLTHKHLLSQSRPSILYFYFYLQARICGDFQKARAFGQQSVASAQDSRDPRALGWMLAWNAEFHALMDELDTAQALLNAAEQVNKRVGDAALQCVCLRVTGIRFVLRSDPTEAIECFERSLCESKRTGFLLDCDNLLLWLLTAYRLADRCTEADATLRHLLSGAVALHHYLIPGILEEAALLLQQRSAFARAQTLVTVAQTLRQTHRIARTPAEERILRPLLPTARCPSLLHALGIEPQLADDLKVLRGEPLLKCLRLLAFDDSID